MVAAIAEAMIGPKPGMLIGGFDPVRRLWVDLRP
jgi:hypothetical protein